MRSLDQVENLSVMKGLSSEVRIATMSQLRYCPGKRRSLQSTSLTGTCHGTKYSKLAGWAGMG